MLLPKLFYFLALFVLSQRQVLAYKKSYVVYLGGHSHGPEITSVDLDRVTNSHVNLLSSFLGSQEKAKNAIFYSYQRHINGFAAMLEEVEAGDIAKHPDVVSVFPNELKKLHTTHTWEFLGLERKGVIPKSSLWKRANFGEDVIIAHIDTGVWPKSKSFSDDGYGPVPQKWKGGCNSSDAVPCNKKLIGARYFSAGVEAAVGGAGGSIWGNYSSQDLVGHGTHTLSTAGGNFVEADVLGAKLGIAKGGSPRARVATYKACWINGGCFDADVLAAFDHAIHDGVDVISVSLGARARDYFRDATAIGSFHAMQKNIVVTCSAGNDYFNNPGSVNNVAPWFITVGASTIDRTFKSTAVLPNGLKLQGSSLSKPLPERKYYPLVHGANAKDAQSSSDLAAALCKYGSLDPNKVKGKIVVCLKGVLLESSLAAAESGAAGVILCNTESNDNNVDDLENVFYDMDQVPTVHISHKDSISLFKYMNSTTQPEAYITPTASIFGAKPFPAMAPFSSVGPNPITQEILKPDITAPGTKIVASYSPLFSPSGQLGDLRTSNFSILSGTSMACPHVAGVAGLLKNLHPDWSPAAIRSAIMTTARARDNTQHQIRVDYYFNNTTPFNFGAGHIEPNSAGDPGLIYDLTAKDHFYFLCAIGYNQTLVKLITGGSYVCPKDASIHNFNYPSITVTNLNSAGKVTVSRTLKNVGAPATYSARIHPLAGVSVSVEPETLRFTKPGEEMSFKMTLEAKWFLPSYVFGALTWSDGHHHVRSPIVVGGATL